MFEQQQKVNLRSPLFYFKYQMKIEFIPYIELQITQFLQFCEQKVQQRGLRQQILLIIRKRISDIDNFFDDHWSDYRAQQILRARIMMIKFIKKYHHLLSYKEKDQIQNGQEEQEKNKIKSEIVKVQIAIKKQQPVEIKQERLINKNKQITSKLVKDNSFKNLQNSTSAIKKSNDERQIQTSQSRIQKEQNIILSKLKEAAKKQAGSPIEKRKEIPQRKLTKEQYILYLRNKKA